MTMTDEIQILNDIDIVIETAIENAALLCEKEYSHEQIIEIMKTENDFEKQICLLKLKTLKSQEEADLLVFQLTGHHGLIREAAASKINEIILNGKYNELFLNKYAVDSFIKAVNDINPNICRLICVVIRHLLSDSNEFKNYFLMKLYKRFEEIFEELEKLKRSRLYTKQLFNLYWGLEALGILAPPVCVELESVLERAANMGDYTIREKAAMVLASLAETSTKLDKIKSQLKNDENFYVQRFAKAF